MSYEEKYKEYEEKLYAITDASGLLEDNVNALFSELLTILPNGGKLYKYKSLDSFHIDEFEQKYIWFSSAKCLNDNKDCTFNANVMGEIETLVKFFLKDNNYRKTLVNGFYLEISKSIPGITQQAIENCFDCVTKYGNSIGKKRFDIFCLQYNLTKAQKQKLLDTISLYGDEKQNETSIRNSISNLAIQMQGIRNSMQILSLTTSYKKDSMWAYYCNNKGICIEYDFSKISDVEFKKLFINTEKVRYGRKRKFSYISIIKAKIKNDSASFIDADKMIMEQILTKDKSWATEEEWRVTMHDRGNCIGRKVPINLVSAIYIDYSVLKKNKTKQIIRIAKENGWNIYVRFFDEFNAEYKYKTIKDTNRLIKEMDQLKQSVR